MNDAAAAEHAARLRARDRRLLAGAARRAIARFLSHRQPRPWRLQRALQRYRCRAGRDQRRRRRSRSRECASMRRNFSPDLAPKLSLFWTDRSFTIGRFPPLDRLDYLDHAQPLIERERAAPPRPSLDEVRAYLARPATRFLARADRARRRAGRARRCDAPHLHPRPALHRALPLQLACRGGWLRTTTPSRSCTRSPSPASTSISSTARSPAGSPIARRTSCFGERGKLAGQLAACLKIIGA